MTKQPSVSVVIPCFNARSYIKEAIESAFSQGDGIDEVIVVDDGSNDGSLDLLLHLQQSVYTNLVVANHSDNQNLGVAQSRLLGASIAQSYYIAFLDADDIYFPEKTKVQLELLENHRECILCHSHALVIGQELEAKHIEAMFMIHPTQIPYSYVNRKDLFTRNGICTSSVIVNRQTLLALPGISAQLFQFEDWCTWTLLGQYGKFICSDKSLVGYRFHAESSTYYLVKSKTKEIYSRVEFYTTLAALSNSIILKMRALLWAHRSIHTLVRQYIRSSISLPKMSPSSNR